MLCGDTRFDRVKAIADHPQPFPVIQQFIAGHPVLMAGSTWPEDEELLIRLIEKRPAGLRFVIAPHEVYQERIQSLISKIGQPVKTYSSLTSSRDSTSDILVIDTIGMLSHLYQYATLVYIGGGFGKGIHNILEAAAFGKSLLFGPNHHRFQEAIDLIRSGGAFPISSADELIQQVGDLISDPLKYQASAEASGTYVQTHTGAADLILHNIQSIKKIS